MKQATYRTLVSTADWGTVAFEARSAANDLTIVDEVRAICVSRIEPGISEVTVTYRALNEAEAAATAHTIHLALAHLAPTDEGTLKTKENAR